MSSRKSCADAQYREATLPPDDDDTILEKACAAEMEAYKALEDQGYPPCYSPRLEFPLTEERAVLCSSTAYFLLAARSNLEILRAQREDWEKFRSFQQDTRREVEEKDFSHYITQTHALRQSYDLDIDVMWSHNLHEQSWEANWSEYQHWQILASMQKKKRMTELNGIIGKLERDLRASRQQHDDVRSEYERHLRLLEWTKEQEKPSETRRSQAPIKSPTRSRPCTRSFKVARDNEARSGVSTDRSKKSAKPKRSLGITKNNIRRRVGPPARYGLQTFVQAPDNALSRVN